MKLSDDDLQAMLARNKRIRERSGSGKFRKPPKYHFTPEMDEQIRKIYQTEVGIKAVAYKGPVKDLAKKFGMPRWKVSRRALELGILPVGKKAAPWTENEMAILERNAHLTPAVVQKYFKKAGYSRTVQAIMIKRKRNHISRNSMDGYTGKELAECFGIDGHAVARWIARGLLKARRRGTARTPQQHGDEYYIIDKWVKDFIIKNVVIIDFRKLDKYWLVDMLTDGARVYQAMEAVNET